MKIARILVSILVPFVLLILFANILTTNMYLTLSKDKYPSHDNIYYDHDYAIERIIGYLNYRYDDLLFGLDEDDDSVIMRDIEIRHMVDVKNVYTFLRISALGAFLVSGVLLFYMYRKNKEELYKTLKYMYVGPALFISFVGGYILIDFQTAFTAFHKIFFSNDDWILYSNDVLILLLPQNFWMVSGIIILVLTALSLGLIYVINERLYHKK
jgi:integral membrane protein (TIGR01906 family)